MNELNTPTADAAPHRARFVRQVRRALVVAGVTGALALGGVAVPTVASAAEPATVPAALHSATLFPSRCLFGHHRGSRGCRGGSVVQAVQDDGYVIATNVGCTAVGIGAGAVTANPAVGAGAGIGCGILLDSAPAG